jgi:hypothetical protein
LVDQQPRRAKPWVLGGWPRRPRWCSWQRAGHVPGGGVGAVGRWPAEATRLLPSPVGQRWDSGSDSCWCAISRGNHAASQRSPRSGPDFIGRSGHRSSITRGSPWSCPDPTWPACWSLGIRRQRVTPIPARHLYACEESERSAPSASPSGPPRPWTRRVRKVVAGWAWADHSTVKVPPPRGTARYAPPPLRGARACRDSVPMPGQAHLLRSPIWQGRWPADCPPPVSLVSW